MDEFPYKVFEQCCISQQKGRYVSPSRIVRRGRRYIHIRCFPTRRLPSIYSRHICVDSLPDSSIIASCRYHDAFLEPEFQSTHWIIGDFRRTTRLPIYNVVRVKVCHGICRIEALPLSIFIFDYPNVDLYSIMEWILI
jgi:hypothetical protein